MLKYLTVKNFQSHKETKIELVEGVNVIVGKSQSGKTAILRSLKLLSSMRPRGIRFKRKGARGPVVVDTETAEGHQVTLSKGKNSSVYTVDGEEFKKFGSNVPDDISSILNLSELNIQSQLDSPFLITDSNHQISAAINKITNMEEGDKWIKKTNERIRNVSTALKYKRERHQELKEQMKGYRGFLKAKGPLLEAEELDKALMKRERRIIALERTIEEFNEWKVKYDRLEKLLRAKHIASEIKKVQGGIDQRTEKMAKLESYIEREGKLPGIKDDIGKMKKVKETMEGMIRTQTDKKLIEGLLTKLKEKEVTIGDLKKTMEVERDDYVRILKQLGKCPTCFSKIKDIKTITRNL